MMARNFNKMVGLIINKLLYYNDIFSVKGKNYE